MTLKKIIAASLALMISGFAFAETDRTITKTELMQVTENLRLRKTESTSSEILTTLKAGSPVQVVQIGKSDVIDGIKSNWVKVKLLPGAKGLNGYNICLDFYRNGGWCFGGYLSKPEDSTYWLLSDQECTAKLEEAVKEKSFEKLQSYINYGTLCNWGRYYYEDAVFHIYNPICMTIKYDWQEGFDWIKDNYPKMVNKRLTGDKFNSFEYDPMVDALYSPNNYYLQEISNSENLGANNYWAVVAIDMNSNKIDLYKSPSESASHKTVKSDTYYTSYTVLEIGEEVYPSVCAPYLTKGHGEASYFIMNRWIKIYDKSSGKTGWLKPGDTLWTSYTYYVEISK